MTIPLTLNVNGVAREIAVDPETPLLFVLRNDFGLKGPKFGCGLEQCNSCKVLVDGTDVPSCQLPVSQVEGAVITTVEGLGSTENLHPLQEAFLEEQAGQCGYCTAGMIIAAQGLLNRTRYPSDDEIRSALNNNLCRCGVYDRVRRAIRLRIGRPIWEPIYEVQNQEPLQQTGPAVDLPESLQQTPDLDAWIRINDDGTITIFSGKVELGQGIKTALAQISAEELDVSLEHMHVISGDTDLTPDEGVTAGSMSVETSGSALRIASAEARHLMLLLAFEHLESKTPASGLQVTDGVITDPATGRQTAYWELMGGKLFGRQVTGTIPPKDPDDYALVGQAEKRLDLLNKVTGGVSYIHDIDLPEMLHARVIRPPGYHARLVSFDEAAILALPGVVAVVKDGSFLAVVASREDEAARAMEVMREKAAWKNEKPLPAQETMYDDLLNKPSKDQLIVKGTPADDPIPAIQAPAEAVQTLTATYYRPFHMHGSLGPSAAAAQWVDGRLTIWSHTQSVFDLRSAIADVIGIDVTQVRVIHREGAGCYGHNGADDVALDAALVARAVPGRPILLKWTRSDEHGWEPYGSAMVLKMQASVDKDGVIVDWNQDFWSYTHSTRPKGGSQGSGLLAAWHLAKPFSPPPPRPIKAPHFGDYRNADPRYDFPRKRVVRHFVPDGPLRTSALRSLGAYANVFAIESFMDELALAAGLDPLEFRLRHINDDRAKAVLRAAADKAGWEAHPRPSTNGHGWGIAFAQYKNRQCYAAIAVEVSVNRDTGLIHLERVVIAADAGQVVNPDGLSNQLEGGFVQAASWTLLEQVNYNREGITSLDWDTYPILRFQRAPVIETVILDRPELPFLGSGEATQNPTPAAIANAVFDAVGIRLREIPFTPERVKALL